MNFILKDKFIDLFKHNDNIVLYGTLDERQSAVVSLNVKGIDSSELSYILNIIDICTRPSHEIFWQ